MSYRENYAEIEWLPLSKHEPQPIRKARSALPMPFIIGDTMEPTQSMLDGRTYTSKSRLRQTYREAGVVEVGNEPIRPPPAPRTRVDRRDVRVAVERAFSKAGLGA